MRIELENYLERRAKENRAKAKHKSELEDKYGLSKHPKADLLYELAWRWGHSSGFSEVEIYYEDFAELLKEG